MGTGKTTVGRMVARQLRAEFIDSDREIERRAGLKVAEIFEQAGEPAFREWEKRFVIEGHPARGCVVACGGGLIVPDGMIELLLGRGVVITLHASLATIVERTGRSKHRPLLRGEDKVERVKELFSKREAIYRRPGLSVLTDNRPQREVAEHVLRLYRHEVSRRGENF